MASGGRVHPSKHKVSGFFRGPARVWLAGEKGPGLAMSRSIGDYTAHTVGVIPDPVVTVQTLEPEDQIIVIASDGVWEVMTNLDVAMVAMQYYPQEKAESAANAVVTQANQKWRESGKTSTDDITCVVLFLD